MTVRALLPSRRELQLAAAGAVLLFLAYPPASLVLPSFVALIPLLLGLEGAAAGPRFEAVTRHGGTDHPIRFGYWWGVLTGGVVLYWMVVALWHFTPLSALGYAASLFLGLGPLGALTAWIVVTVRTRTTLPLWVVFPLTWTAVEWVLGHLLDLRFPWLGLGTSLTRVPVLVQWAELAGARGVTLWLAWANVELFQAMRRRSARRLGVVLATAALAAVFGTWRERSLYTRSVTRVALVQPNVGFDEKRESREDARLLQQLLDLTRQAVEDTTVRLVIWPEVAVPVYFVNHPEYKRAIAALARELEVPILTGGLDAEFHPDGSYDYYNAAFFFDATGADTAPSYRKRYLVPIVERVPFLPPQWFGALQYFGGFGVGDRFPVYRLPRSGRFGVLICYESAFEDLARRYRWNRATFLVNITNDAWFGRTAAPYQHAAHLVMRAIETRLGIARAANTGISMVVDPFGYTSFRTPLMVERVERVNVRTADLLTWYTRLGDWVGLVALVGTGACLAAAFLRFRHTFGEH